MEKALGVKVNAFFAPDYAGVIEGMRFDKVDVAWFGNKPAMEAVDRAGGEIFAQTIKDDGAKGYYSLLLVHKDSPIQSLDDVLRCDQSLNFGNGDPNSTSGFLVPSFYVWAQNGIDPKDCFKRVVNANHETNALGAGGIGVLLWEYIRGLYYSETAAVMIMIIVTVSLLDVFSQFIRKRFT